MRKIREIGACAKGVYALANDGSLWFLKLGSSDWILLEPIPQSFLPRSLSSDVQHARTSDHDEHDRQAARGSRAEAGPEPINRSSSRDE